MSWTPKPGDRVTSPLLVGEWEVTGPEKSLITVEREGRRLIISAAYLTPVAPPLPPEPPIGTVVWALDRMYMHGAGEWFAPVGSGPWHYATWPDIAADAVPVVAVEDVADWIDENADLGRDGEHFLAEFGGWGE